MDALYLQVLNVSQLCPSEISDPDWAILVQSPFGLPKRRSVKLGDLVLPAD